MEQRWDRILDRLWLSLSGIAALAVALHWGVQLGHRTWSSGTPVLTAEAAPAPFRRSARPGSGCRDGEADPAR